ncbi:hypothetical protein CTA1_5541 [Colletotrichum tanaceti]|uniref:Methyltransferase domain-containing protein n=1 Tax=Colletotrichum tanaceti TaxID=1306861 RepID=A0A4U6X647_9PEZI|nr:hypothetical protein CTA1_5541 [Colletotrichum tanaceti]
MQVASSPIVLGDKSKAAPWYSIEARITPEAREMLQEYAGIPPEDVKDHILTTDLRRLVHDGVDSAKTVAVELEQGYIDAGYELFRDRDTLRTRFVNADMLDDRSAELDALEGSFDTAHLGLCLHLWNREEQMVVLGRVIRLLKQKPGVVILGHAAGHADGIDVPGVANRPALRHNQESWEKMWADISKQTGTKWELKTEVSDYPGTREPEGRPSWWDKDMRFLGFEVTRVE